jgi:CxxC motif-containing protein (DUF1111 family)
MKTKSFDYLLIAGVVGSIGAAPGCSSQSGGTASLTQAAAVASDPGPAAGAPRAGGANGAVGTLNSDEQALYARSLTNFNEVDSVTGQLSNGSGLGPAFNMNSCAGCHIHPDVGGSSPAIDSGVTGNSSLDDLPIARQNPQIAVATLDGAQNVIPAFITPDGPVREARLKTDNGVHDLFTIAGRSDAPGCAGLAFNFSNEIANDNVVFRIPLATFGLGLVELVTEDTLTNNLASDQFGDPPQFGKHTVFNITGALNHSGNDGTITRFGWKAQNKSLLMFSGEAYNVEQGVSNILFPNERDGSGTNMNGCFSLFNSVPEDTITLPGAIPAGTQPAYEAFPDIMRFTFFMEMTAPPAALASTPSTTNGSAVFDEVGCSGCHTRTLQTGPKSMFTGMENQTFHPFSDFAIHDMGSVLADGVSQGAAGPTQFRSTPLWGVGQRVFFLHDGRTRDIREAILAHSNGDGEAAVSINQFQQLSGSDQQDLLNFLRSL